MKMKKRLSLLLAIALMLGAIAPGVMAAERAVASTLRLDATEGTVSVSNRAGKSISVTARMKLYAGYSVATALESYGYISLDDTKAIKLDAKSEVQLKQSGQKLEVGLISGKLFFDVTAPLKESESLNIRTSTMVTGIRGTSGFVRVINEKVSEIYLFSGEVHLTSTDPLTGETVTAILKAGQRATSYVRDTAWGEEIVEIVIDGFVESDVPGYVAAAVRDDPDLQRRITEETNLSVPLIIGRAEERLAEDEAAMREQSTEIQQEQDALDNNRLVDPLFKDDQPTGGGGGTSTPVPPTSISLATANSAVIMSSFASYQQITVTGAATIDAPVNINPGQTLILQDTIAMTSDIINRSDSTLIIESSASFIGSPTGMIFNGVDDAAKGEFGTGLGSIEYTNNAGSLVIKPGVIVPSGITIVQDHAGSKMHIYGDADYILSYDGDVIIYADPDGPGPGVPGKVESLFVYGGTSTVAGTSGFVRVDGGEVTINGLVDDGLILDGGKVTLTGTGKIQYTGAGSAVEVFDGSFLMEGGSIIAGDNAVKMVSGEFIQNGGVIEGPGSNFVVVIQKSSTYTMKSGTAKSNPFSNDYTFEVFGTLEYNGGTITGKIKGATDGSDSTTSGNLVGSGIGSLSGQLEGTFVAPSTLCSIDGKDIPIYGSLVAILGYLSDNYSDALSIIIKATTCDIDIGNEETLTIGSNITIDLKNPAGSTFDIISGKVELDGTIDMTGDAQLAVYNGATLTINTGGKLSAESGSPTVAFETAGGIKVFGGTFEMSVGTLYTPNTSGPFYGISAPDGHPTSHLTITTTSGAAEIKPSNEYSFGGTP